MIHLDDSLCGRDRKDVHLYMREMLGDILFFLFSELLDLMNAYITLYFFGKQIDGLKYCSDVLVEDASYDHESKLGLVVHITPSWMLMQCLFYGCKRLFIICYVYYGYVFWCNIEFLYYILLGAF